MSRSRYVHGSHPEEQDRLSLLNRLINEGSLAELDLKGGESILDLGSGLGQFSRAMARRGCRVVGIERSDEQIAGARERARAEGEEDAVDFRQGEATDLPLRPEEWGGFDVVHTRFLLEHLPDPLAAVRGMVKAARPGGRIVLEDDDHDVLRLWPEAPRAERLWNDYIDLYERLGNEPRIGRRLVQLLVQAGAEPVRNTTLFFGSCAGQPRHASFVENLAGVLEGAREALIEHGLADAVRVDEALAELAAWGKRPDASLWYARFWAEGRRP